VQHFHFPRRAAVLAAALAVLAGAGTIATAVATASPSVSFALYSNGDSTAVYNASHQPVLTAGKITGTSAQVQVVSPPDAAPTSAPTFNASAAGGGDPRWVILFHNGQILNGGPATTGQTPSAWTWSCPLASQSGSYAVALAACQAGGLDDQVTAAFIVDDAGFPGTAVTLTNVQYDGVTLTAPPPPPLVKIPNVTGMRASAALIAIRAAGFQAVTSPLRNPKYTYVATGTSPTGSAPKGSLVIVHVKVA
jgi:hypothetical protein